MGDAIGEECISLTIESTLSSLPARETLLVNGNHSIGEITELFLTKVDAPTNTTFIIRDGAGLVLKQSLRLREAGLKDGAFLYLSTIESERALFSYTNWWLVAFICKIFAVGLLFGCVTAWFCGGGQPYTYTTVIDAGSVHTSVYTYRFSGEKLKGTGVIEEASYCEMGQVGISSYIDNPSDIKSYINSSCARKSSERPNSIAQLEPIFLGATAGMRIQRLVEAAGSSWIMGNLTKQLRLMSPENRAEATILSGKDEGLKGWVTTNYLMNVFGTDPNHEMVPDVIIQEDQTLKEGTKNQEPANTTTVGSQSIVSRRPGVEEARMRTYGALDWGGASAQYTLEVPREDSNYNISLYGETYFISAQSFLCYGQQEAVNRHRAVILYEWYKTYNNTNNSIPASLTDPCAPKGSNVTFTFQEIFESACTKLNNLDFMNKVAKLSGSLDFVGSSELQQCQDLVLEHFNHTLCLERFGQYESDIVCLDPGRIISPPNQNFYAMSTYWYLTSALDLPESHELSSYNERMETVCGLQRTELLNYGIKDLVADTACFKIVFMKALLTEGYHFNETLYKQIKFVKRVGGADVGWTLGHAVLASNNIPAITATVYLSDMMFVVLLVISFLFVVLATFFAYQARQINAASSRYQRFATKV